MDKNIVSLVEVLKVIDYWEGISMLFMGDVSSLLTVLILVVKGKNRYGIIGGLLFKNDKIVN